METEKAFYERLEGKGVSRREFMKFCTFLTATMGLSSSFVPKVAEVFAAPGQAQRPPVIWLHFGECTGCTEALVKSMYPLEPGFKTASNVRWLRYRPLQNTHVLSCHIKLQL